MTEIQRLLTETIESLNTREKRDNKPRFSISFIRKHPGLFIGMYVAFFCHAGSDVAVRNPVRFSLAPGSVIHPAQRFLLFLMSTHATATKISTYWIFAFAITANGITRALSLLRWLKPY